MSLCVRNRTPAFQFAADFGMVDDLTVADDRVAAVLAGDRLVPARDVDNAETAHAEAEIAIDQVAGVIGPAVIERSHCRAIASCGTVLRAFCTNRRCRTSWSPSGMTSKVKWPLPDRATIS